MAYLGQRLELPITLADNFSPRLVLASTVIPAATFAIVDYVILQSRRTARGKKYAFFVVLNFRYGNRFKPFIKGGWRIMNALVANGLTKGEPKRKLSQRCLATLLVDLSRQRRIAMVCGSSPVDRCDC